MPDNYSPSTLTYISYPLATGMSLSSSIPHFSLIGNNNNHDHHHHHHHHHAFIKAVFSPGGKGEIHSDHGHKHRCVVTYIVSPSRHVSGGAPYLIIFKNVINDDNGNLNPNNIRMAVNWQGSHTGKQSAVSILWDRLWPNSIFPY